MKEISKATLLASVAIALLLILTASDATAQHCPFDGGHMIVVQLTDADDKPLFGSAADLTLREIENPEADSCSFTKGMISRAFLPPVDAFMQRYQRHGSENFRNYCDDCAFNADGFYAVIIGQSERSCMIKKETIPTTATSLESSRYAINATASSKRSRFLPIRSLACVPETGNGHALCRSNSD
jgi:hypothetical protein